MKNYKNIRTFDELIDLEHRKIGTGTRNNTRKMQQEANKKKEGKN